MSLADLIAMRFIARPDVRAIQNNDGSYRPQDGEPFTRAALDAHLKGNATYGHYLLDSNNQCKFFCFDIDLGTNGFYWIEPDLALASPALSHDELGRWYEENRSGPHPVNPREAWVSREQTPRAHFKTQFRSIAEILTSAIYNELGIGTCASYSGHKGIHVYGFTGRMDAGDVRIAAAHVLRSTGIFVPKDNSEVNYVDGSGEYPNLSLELFPKQSEVEKGKYGNLLRLDLGINRKSPNDATFFLDQTKAPNTFAPHANPVQLLEEAMPWRDVKPVV